MAVSVVVEQSSVSVVPGEMGTCTVRVRNTGAVVDQFSLTVLGQPAAWTSVVPAALSLFPNADGTIELHFAPPRAPGVGLGSTPFGVRVVGSQDPENPVVEEGEVDLSPFVDVTSKLTPRTSETKRKARHEIVLDNKGNTAVSVTLSVTDPDEQLAFGLQESLVTVAAGQAAHVPLKVAARKGFARGADKHRPFQVSALPEGAAYPLTMDGNLIQKPGMPRFVIPMIAGVVAVGLAAALLPLLLMKDGGKGNLQLTSEDGATTTVVAPSSDDEDDAANPDDGPATLEEAQAAAAAELAANGKDPNAATPSAGGPAGDGGETSSAGGGGAVAAPTTTLNTDDGPAVTAAPATTAAPPPPPGGATTTVPATTTTTAPPHAKFVGTWKNVDPNTNHEPQTVIRADATYLYVRGYGACSPSYCDWGEGKTTLADGGDNEINVSIPTSVGAAKQRITWVNGQLKIHTDQYRTDGTFWYARDEVFNRA